MADKYPDIKVTVICFAGPKIGNKEFKNWSEQKSNLAVWRYVYNYDIVPRLGPTWVLGFVHAGHTFQIWQRESKSIIYYRHVGNGGMYAGVPWSWSWPCKYNMGLVVYTILEILNLKVLSNRPTTQTSVTMNFLQTGRLSSHEHLVISHYINENYDNPNLWPNQFARAGLFPVVAT